MKTEEILSMVDHTLLDRCATTEQIRETLDDAMRYGCASACIPPSYVRWAREYVGEGLRICTVIGFPNGYSTTEVKVFETERAIADGADEIDTVVNLCHVKDGRLDLVLSELRAIKSACRDRVLKVIIETCLLTDEEKLSLCSVVTESGADFIKTSTGFSHGGATPEDVALLSEGVGEGVGVKAAGGISCLADAEQLIGLGATRLGTSRIVKAVKSGSSAKPDTY